MRDIPVGNGSLLVTFDDKYQIRDIYFPHVGQENHTEGFPFRFGFWAQVKSVRNGAIQQALTTEQILLREFWIENHEAFFVIEINRVKKMKRH